MPNQSIPELIDELLESAAHWKRKNVLFTSNQFERAASALARLREETLEEAAKVCERLAKEDGSWNGSLGYEAQRCADEIRALSGKSTGTGGEW